MWIEKRSHEENSGCPSIFDHHKIVGFADTVDGLAGRGDREKTLAIMRDSRIGAFAVVEIAVLLLLKTTALTSLPLFMKDKALLLMPVLGRWATVPLAAFLPYARGGPGTALAFTRFAGIRDLSIASVIALMEICTRLYLIRHGRVVNFSLQT
ncbi:MAG: adenosylcobinamide-GDP ribazoletransferase [Syntrophales bacterium]|nr:adenosylcobinamide-GDP ribazoletransferase [Syntrophales bacterium]